MRISIHKEFIYKPEGLTFFPGSHEVRPEIAVAAVLEKATDTPEALALAEEAGAHKSADKALSKMKADELRAEVKRLRSGDPDLKLQEEIDSLKTQLDAAAQAATAAKTAAHDNIIALTEDLTAARLEVKTLTEAAAAVLEAHNTQPDITEAQHCETLDDLAQLINSVNAA